MKRHATFLVFLSLLAPLILLTVARTRTHGRSLTSRGTDGDQGGHGPRRKREQPRADPGQDAPDVGCQFNSSAEVTAVLLRAGGTWFLRDLDTSAYGWTALMSASGIPRRTRKS